MYKVWNEDKTRYFVTPHLRVAEAVCEGEELVNAPPIAHRFSAICANEHCTIEELER